MSDLYFAWFNIHTCLERMFEKPKEDIHRKKMDLIARNTKLTGYPNGFSYLGEVYTHLDYRAAHYAVYKPIHPDLLPEMDKFLQEQNDLNQDYTKIRQALILLISGCNTDQDLRDAIPNCLLTFFPELNTLPRTREEAFTIKDNPRSYRQYMQVRERMEYYAALQLLY